MSDETSLASVDAKPKGRRPMNQAAKKKAINKKLSPEAAKLLETIKEKANKKSFGRKVRDGEILALSLQLIGDEHIKALQDATLSERDRLNMAHQEFQKHHGRLSLDDFIGKLLKGEYRVN